MKTSSNLKIATALLSLVIACQATATTFFTDDFSNGSTTNQLSLPGGTSTAAYTSYDFASSKNSTASSIAANLLRGKLTGGTTSGYWEAQALFATGTNAASLNSPGDYVEVAIVFTNSAGTLLNASGCELWIGLYNSGSSSSATNFPVAGALANAGLTTTAGSSYATGNCQLWQGYAWRMLNGAGSRIITRPVQDGAGTSSANQELLGSGVSGGTFNNPGGATLLTGPVVSYTLATSGAYTIDMRITLDPAGSGSLIVSNGLYSGAGTGGTLIFSNATTTSTILATAFDGLAFGVFNKTASQNPQMDISSITVTGQSSPPVPPTITTQPVPVVVATNGACAFLVEALGNNLTYQWHRNGTSLANGGNISGATSSMLVVSSAGPADALSGANGYYVTVTGSGNLSVDSVTNSLTLIASTNLVYSGSGPWDLNTSPSWNDTNGNSGLYFNFGDPVVFDDVGGGGAVNLTGPFLSASSVTVSHTLGFYTFQGTGSFAGPGSLVYNGSAQLTINNANSYTGGTIISNAAAILRLGNLGGLGTGPVTLAKAGGLMEVLTAGGASSGIQGDVIVNDDFTIKFDGIGGYAGVLFGNLSGVAGKTLTLDQLDLSTTNRYRAYGANTIFAANLVLNGAATSQANYSGTVLAPYNSTGSQTYSGVISGNGGLVQRANGTTILTGANTYAGGTFPTTGTIALGSDTVGNVVSGPIGTGPLFVVPELPNATGSGTVLAYGGARTIANPIQYPSATNNQTLIIGGTNQLTFSGNIALQGQDGLGTFSNRTFQANNTAPTIFSGVISDNGSAFGITKSGTGTLYLNAANTYTGVTTNSAGVLAGTGSLAGSVVVKTNASIGGGSAAAIGTLTVGGNLTIESGGGGFFRANRSGFVSDKVLVAGTLASSGAGKITVTNLGSALQLGDTFAVFNKAVTGGNTLVVTGAVTAGLTWTNKLAVDGTIQVVQSFATYPTNISYSVSGSTLTITWPATHQGWLLQAQTNSLSAGLGTNWVTIPGTDAVTSTNLTIVPGNPTVFYRLKMP